jgi:hypothetical protein
MSLVLDVFVVAGVVVILVAHVVLLLFFFNDRRRRRCRRRCGCGGRRRCCRRRLDDDVNVHGGVALVAVAAVLPSMVRFLVANVIKFLLSWSLTVGVNIIKLLTAIIYNTTTILIMTILVTDLTYKCSRYSSTYL